MINKIKIGGTYYDLEFVDGLSTPDKVNKVNGKISYQMTKIEIESEISSESILESIIHECMHGLFQHADYKPDDNEHIIKILSNGFIQLFRDNPKLIEMIMEVGYFDETT